MYLWVKDLNQTMGNIKEKSRLKGQNLYKTKTDKLKTEIDTEKIKQYSIETENSKTRTETEKSKLI